MRCGLRPIRAPASAQTRLSPLFGQRLEAPGFRLPEGWRPRLSRTVKAESEAREAERVADASPAAPDELRELDVLEDRDDAGDESLAAARGARVRHLRLARGRALPRESDREEDDGKGGVRQVAPPRCGSSTSPSCIPPNEREAQSSTSVEIGSWSFCTSARWRLSARLSRTLIVCISRAPMRSSGVNADSVRSIESLCAS